MNFRKVIFVSALAAIASVASAQVSSLGPIELTNTYVANDDGTFGWSSILGPLNTYCFSTGNDFSQYQNPQLFNVYAIGSLTTAAQVTSSGILSNNQMVGLTANSFLAAVAQAEIDGPATLDTVGVNNNFDIHTIEGEGDSAVIPVYGGTNTFYYLQEANTNPNFYPGQPQGLVLPGGSNFNVHTPGPVAILPFALGLLRRRRAKATA